MEDKTEEKISYQKSLSTLFASSSMLAFGALSLLNNFSLDYYSILFMLSIVIPVSLSMGFIGFVIGKIFDEGENFHPCEKVKKNITRKIDNADKRESMFSSEAVMQEASDSMFDESNETKEDEQDE